MSTSELSKTGSDLDLPDLVVRAVREKVCEDITHDYLSSLKYAHLAKRSDLTGVMLNVKIREKGNHRYAEYEIPDFICRDDPRKFDFLLFSELSAANRTKAGRVHTAMSTDITLHNWIDRRLSGQGVEEFPHIQEYEVVALRNAIVMRQPATRQHGSIPGANDPRRFDHVPAVLSNVQVAIAPELSNHDLIETIQGVSTYLNDRLFRTLFTYTLVEEDTYNIRIEFDRGPA